MPAYLCLLQFSLSHYYQGQSLSMYLCTEYTHITKQLQLKKPLSMLYFFSYSLRISLRFEKELTVLLTWKKSNCASLVQELQSDWAMTSFVQVGFYSYHISSKASSHIQYCFTAFWKRILSIFFNLPIPAMTVSLVILFIKQVFQC